MSLSAQTFYRMSLPKRVVGYSGHEAVASGVPRILVDSGEVKTMTADRKPQVIYGANANYILPALVSIWSLHKDMPADRSMSCSIWRHLLNPMIWI